MKPPEEIKKGLKLIASRSPQEFIKCAFGIDYECNEDIADDALAYIQQLEDAIDNVTQLMQSATEVIKKNQEQLESTYSQVKKALCGKENVSWVEVLEAADQLKSRLAQVERERDALMAYAKGSCATCAFEDDCAKHDPDPDGPNYWWYDDCEEWQWRGVCAENTEEETK